MEEEIGLLLDQVTDTRHYFLDTVEHLGRTNIGESDCRWGILFEEHQNKGTMKLLLPPLLLLFLEWERIGVALFGEEVVQV